MKTALLVLTGVVAGVLLLGVVLIALSGPPLEAPGGAGDDYCTAEKEDRLAAAEGDSSETINDPRKLRRYTRRFLRSVNDAPRDAWCVDNRVEFLIDVWNSARGEDGYPDAAEQVRRLRRIQAR